jgi:formyltetrahydrofolate hydrolase
LARRGDSPFTNHAGSIMTARAKRALPGHLILVLKCPDRTGVVAAVSGFLADNDASIVESNHFNEPLGDEFYMRTVFRADGAGMPSIEAFSRAP